LCRRQAGDFREAIADFNQALARDADFAEAYNNRGYAYLGLLDYVRATADFTEAIRRLPPFAPAYNNRGLAILRSKISTGPSAISMPP
jgi:tetratricopeptide (TPR) repeat protein